MSNKICQLLLLHLFLSLLSCNDITKTERFDQAKWISYNGVDGPDRDIMASDLIKSNKLIGLSHKQMLKLLGEPANYNDTTKTYYELSEEFDTIDPVAGKI